MDTQPSAGCNTGTVAMILFVFFYLRCLKKSKNKNLKFSLCHIFISLPFPLLLRA